MLTTPSKDSTGQSFALSSHVAFADRRPIEKQVRTGVHVIARRGGMTLINSTFARERALVYANHIARELKQPGVSP